MLLVVSLIILGLSIYLFVLTRQRIVDMKSEAAEEVRREMDAVITEFNRSAVRNIELLEDKIGEIQKFLEKADRRILQLDNRIARSEKPIVIEKIVHSDPKSESLPKTTRKPRKKRKQSASNTTKKAPVVSSAESASKSSEVKKKLVFTPKEEPRSDRLKRLIAEGTSTQELIALGFHENEINLIKFLVSKK